MRDAQLRSTVRTALNNAVQTVANQVGCQGKILQSLLSDDALIYTIKFAVAETMAVDANAACVAVGLPADTMGRTYEKEGHTFTVIDAIPQQYGVKIRVQREDGLVLKLGHDTLFIRLGLVEPEPSIPPEPEDEIE